MIALRGVHVDKMDADSSLSAMTHDGAHFYPAPDFRFFDPEMDFDFCSDGVLLLAKDAHPDRTQVSQEAGRELTRRPKENPPIRGAPRAGSSFVGIVVGQSLSVSCKRPKPKIAATLTMIC